MSDIGNAYAEFDDIGSSMCVFNILNEKIFNERKIEVTFFD